MYCMCMALDPRRLNQLLTFDKTLQSRRSGAALFFYLTNDVTASCATNLTCSFFLISYARCSMPASLGTLFLGRAARFSLSGALVRT